MQCPVCGGDTSVDTTRQKSASVVVRYRRCTPHGHTFTTREEVPSVLTRVAVRRSGSGQLSTDPFNLQRLGDDIEQAAMGMLSEAEAMEVASGAAEKLQNDLPRLRKPLRPDEVTGRHDMAGWISDRAIMEAVERTLARRKKSVVLMLYALSVRGRTDFEGRNGWHDAHDFVGWVHHQASFRTLRTRIPARRQVPSDKWWPPTMPSEPKAVVKHDGNQESFDRTKVRKGVEKALLGRPDAQRLSRQVVTWVLWELQGQVLVNTAQLGVGVLDCLRRLDDIAYLRWAVVFKGLRAAEEVHDEALALITHPSARLVFDPQVQPRRPQTRLPHQMPEQGQSRASSRS